jgi:UDP-2,3-diacylglucosamine pyrophosphatase LpxH
VTWVTGNHDAALRRFAPLELGGLEIVDRLELDLDGDRTWFLHGDAFDLAIGTGRIAGRIGGWSYDRLLMLNRGINGIRGWFGLPPMSVARRIAASIPAARRHIARFEAACIAAAAERGVAAIVTGHIHHATDRVVAVDGRPVHLLNSGDWVESCTALEYAHGRWSLVRYDDLRAEGLVDDPRDADRTADVRPMLHAG